MAATTIKITSKQNRMLASMAVGFRDERGNYDAFNVVITRGRPTYSDEQILSTFNGEPLDDGVFVA